MRFAFVVSLWFPFGGMQFSLLRIAKACVARGHQVDIYTGKWQGEKLDNIGVIELDTKAITNHRSNDLLAEQFAAAVAGKDYDCLVGFTKVPGLDVYYAADPCYAARVEEIQYQLRDGARIEEAKHQLYKKLPRYSAYCRQEESVFQPGSGVDIILIAHQEREKFIRHYGTEKDRFHLLPPGINRKRLGSKDAAQDRADIRHEFRVAVSDLLLLVVGSRFKTKGVDRVIRALASLPEQLKRRCKLVIVGHGKASAFKGLAACLGVSDRVIFAGTRSDVNRFYRGADFLVHAPRSENTGTVLIESMLCGLPVLVTENCGFAKHVRAADAGITVPEPFDQELFDGALGGFLESDSREKWTVNGPDYCENTDLYSLIERAADVIIERAQRNRV
ncbi:MAG: glycosyltransferase family 4 protein [Gammaproteobacteria bacterium]|nr:glycosyltransferase family 4 protein [Gammaproteobacteria bacterium]